MKPHVIWNTAMTLDGIIGSKGERLRISNEADKKRTHELRASVDAIMVGVNTVIADNPSLTVKYADGKNPIRIVVDSRARTPADSKVLDDRAKTIVAVTSSAPKERITALEKKGAEVMVVGREKVNLRMLLDRLYEKGVRKLMHEGGGTLNTSMLSAGLIDEVYVTVGPTLAGKGVPIVTSKLSGHGKMRLAGIRQLGSQAVLHYLVEDL